MRTSVIVLVRNAFYKIHNCATFTKYLNLNGQRASRKAAIAKKVNSKKGCAGHYFFLESS
jgi:hypothetical protein